MDHRKPIHPSSEVTVIALLLGCFMSFATGKDQTATTSGFHGYHLSWYSIDGGGVMFSTEGGYELSGTMGQPDAGVLANGGYELTGGFWFQQVPGDCVLDGGVNLLDHDRFVACMDGPGNGTVSPECTCLDLDRSGTVDLVDFALFARSFSGS